ncbi:MAG: xanthine dehydrogenase family protein subunit M [Alphaproteobacteria bacterium]|nr:xanthine dehydrogenase family protein subunit M [Alphaproteobacteria bacterium]
MRPFLYQRASGFGEAVQAATSRNGSRLPPTMAAAQYLAGGTTLLDLMKLDVMRPEVLVDINALDPAGTRIERRADGLYLGAFATMAAAGEHPEIRQNYPVVAQALDLAASPQIRNMATLGGNVLQRTRCNYFRDPSWGACNKREPGTGCAALGGVNRKHAVLGVSEHCIAAYPGDFAQALVALDATVEIVGPGGARVVPFEQLHRLPGATPHIETVLAPSELIVGFRLPVAPWTRRSLYFKIRARQSYEFALASAAVALGLADGIVKEARIALGGVAAKPWRAREAEAALNGRAIDETAARNAADAAFADARVRGDNAYKPELGRRTLVRALLQAAQLSI